MRAIRSTSSLRAKGFAIVAAIFLLVVIAGLGVYMLSLYSAQQTNSSQDLMGARAYQAAKAGIEWGTYQIMSPENTSPAGAPYVCTGVMGTPVFAGTLQGFNVSVSCSQTATTEGANNIRVYQVTATATFSTAPSPDYVERQIAAKVATCRTGAGASPVCT